MQLSTTTIAASLLAAVALAAPGGSSAPRGLEPRVSVTLPPRNLGYLCNTQKGSAGTSNIKIGIEKLKDMDQNCAPGANGAEVRMVAGDGYSFYMGSVDGRQTGGIICKELMGVFEDLAANCGEMLDGDVRAGGVAWVPGYEGYTYVFPTAASK
ncbi:hypothetical protein F4778DRAFT_781014 [Xylariomycetidae sp. FL2044]|nr:hypothetical protein F4778DRAFT_781014 [Xylariomycetidae sp. FL2044]